MVELEKFSKIIEQYEKMYNIDTPAATQIAIKQYPEEWKACKAESRNLIKAGIRKRAVNPAEADIIIKSEELAREKSITKEQATVAFLATPEGAELHKKYLNEIRSR